MEDTNLVLAKILNLAMQYGVCHWDLEFSNLELEDKYETYFFPCIEWLEAEEMIRVGHYSRALGGLANGSVNNIALTSLGMSVLGHEVESTGKVEPLSETVKNVSEGKADYHRIGDTIGGLIGGIVKSFSS